MAGQRSSATSMGKLQIQETFNDPESFASCMLALLLDNYGTEFFDWEPTSLNYQLEDDFSIKLPKVNNDKIWALIVAVTTNQFHVSWEIFSQTCRALNGDEADFSVFSPVDPEDMAWGVTEVLINAPPAEKAGNTDFSSEVKRYAGVVLQQNGIYQPPAVLQFVKMPFDPTLDLDTAFIDDTEMFEVSQKQQKDRSIGLDNYVKTRMVAMTEQMDALPLKNRATYFHKKPNLTRVF